MNIIVVIIHLKPLIKYMIMILLELTINKIQIFIININQIIIQI